MCYLSRYDTSNNNIRHFLVWVVFLKKIMYYKIRDPLSCLHHFQCYFIYITVASAPIHAFLEFPYSVLCTIFFQSQWLPSLITIIEAMDNSKRGIISGAMTTINPQKEYWQSRSSNQQPHLYKSYTRPTELRGLGSRENKISSGIYQKLWMNHVL